MNTPQSESALQSQIVQWLRWSLPADALLTAFPAGGGGKIRGARLKKMGLLPGIPDLILIYKGNVFGMEVKTVRGRLSADQIACRASWVEAGAGHAVVRCLRDAEVALSCWNVPLKYQIAA